VKGNEQHGPNQIPGTNPGAREGSHKTSNVLFIIKSGESLAVIDRKQKST